MLVFGNISLFFHTPNKWANYKHLKNNIMHEKTVLIDDRGSKIYPKMMEDFYCTTGQSILLGTKSELWVDVAEWLILRGARRLVVFVDEDHNPMNKNSFRCKRLTDTFNSLYLVPKSKLFSQEGALQVLKWLATAGDINYIFCIHQDENSNAMKNLDLASRELVPNLRQFVSLLGKGNAVSESRAVSGLPVCSVQCNSPLQNPAQILQYLSTLPANESNSRFFHVSDNMNNSEVKDYVDFQEFVPTTVDELYNMGNCVSESTVFKEQQTLSPGYQYSRHSLLPVFIISPLGSYNVQPLVRHLIHPAFCNTLPVTITSVREYAELLMQAILKVQGHGTINLVGSSWGGPVALDVAHLLEARGLCVRLFLLEGAPTLIDNRIRGLCEKYSDNLSLSLLAETLHLPSEVLKQMTKIDSWDDKLTVALKGAKIAADVINPIARALTCLYHQLASLAHQETPNALCRDLTLMTYKPVCAAYKENITQMMQKGEPTFVTVEEDTYNDFLSNPKTAAEINRNVVFEWKL